MKMKKILRIVCIVSLLLLVGSVNVFILISGKFLTNYEHFLVLLVPVFFTVLVLLAILEDEPEEPTADDDIEITSETKEVVKLFYEKAISMHTETDNRVFQIISIFVPASLLVIGWILSKKKEAILPSEATLIIGSIAVVLVGVATLIKHRLRYYNKIREIYLRKLEKVLLPEPMDYEEYGLHNYVKKKCKTRFFTSFHVVVDLYYFVYLTIWVILYLYVERLKN